MEPYIVTIGSGEIDRYYKAARWPKIGEQLEVVPIHTYVGGLLANAACVMAGYGDCKVYLMGYTDSGAEGRFITDELMACGLDLSSYFPHPKYKTTICNVYLLDGERVIFVSVPPGQMGMHFSPRQSALLKDASMIYSCAGRLRCYDNAISVLTNAKMNGANLCLDLESYVPDPSQQIYLNMADIIFINDHDFFYFSEGADEASFCRSLIDKGLKVICITKGSKGGTVYSADDSFDYEPLFVNAVDTTGAGDTFNGTFVYCLAKGLSLRQAAKFASIAAARAVTITGPHGGIATKQIIDDFFRNYQNSK